MIIEYNGKKPKIGENVFIAPTAMIIGDVVIGDGASVWYGAVLRGDEGSIIVGRDTNIQDNSVLHTSVDYPTVLKDSVTIGHGALLEACTIESGALIGMGAIVLENVIIEEQAMIAAGSVVVPGTRIPSRMLAAGAPAVVKKEISGLALEAIKKSAPVYKHLASSYLKEGLDRSIVFDPTTRQSE